MERSKGLLTLAITLAIGAGSTACDEAVTETPEPTAAEQAAAKAAAEKEAAEKAAAEKEAAEKAAAEAYANRDYFTAATFNLGWAHDHMGGGPKAAEANAAQSDEAWEWKTKAIVEVLIEQQPDVVALHELGGADELSDIVQALSIAGGPEYDYAHEASVGDRSGHHSAIISRFPISGGRRLDIYLKRHVVADVELPNGDTITVVAMHTGEGTRAAVRKGRAKQVQMLRRKLKKARAAGPVLYLASMGTNVSPGDDGYGGSAAGILSGANSKKSEDCDESAAVGSATTTTTDEKVADRIISCGLTLRDSGVVGEDKIVRGYVDKWDTPWSAVPVDKDPMRDVSDHLMVVVEVELPKPPPKEEKPEDGKEEN